MANNRPITLIILDGWGYREDDSANAINSANKPVWDGLWQNYPHTLLDASGRAVGLPEGQMGNSQVGHIHMGAGRLIPQGLTRIDMAIESGEFFANPVFLEAMQQVNQNHSRLHLIGLVSAGGVHSHENHFIALLKLAAEQQVKNVAIHAILDGRDTPPKSAEKSLILLENECHALGVGKIASIIGRYYAMDRDQRWERTEKAYNLLTLGEASFIANDARSALQTAYERNETDEFVQATSIHAENTKPITIDDKDVVIFVNFRTDRARQLTHAFVDKNFDHFPRKKHPHLSSFITMTEYEENLPVNVAFPPLKITNSVGEYVAKQGLKQLRIAETEKYAHVTFFFNGGEEKQYAGEDRILVPSPKIATYDLQPEMSAYEVTEKLVNAIRSQKYDLIICNFANPDMVGHTGDFKAAVKAIETIDQCLNKIIEALNAVNAEALITADHGNAELMFDPATQQAHTAHTSLPVPCIYVGRDAEFTTQLGTLYDVGPTLLYLLGLKKPAEMTGHNLLHFIE